MPFWLWFCICLIIIVALAVIVLLLSAVTIRIHVKKQGADEEITADVKLLFGMVKLHYEVPKIKFDNLKKGFKVSSQSRSHVIRKVNESDMREEHVGTEKVQSWKESYKRILRATVGLKKWLTQTLKHVRVTKLSWSTKLAFREADYTAVTSGLIWGVKSFLVGALSYRVHMQSAPQLSVRPIFGTSPQFATEMNCIVKISLGYAMYAGLTLIVRVLKVKGGIKQWVNILFKA